MAGENILVELLGRITIARVVGAVLSFIVISFIVDIAQLPRYPKSIPRVGHGSGMIATVRNWLGYVFHFPEWVDSGYKKYSKHDRAFVVPSAASRPQEVVVPPSQTAWMLELPDRILSSAHAQSDVMYSEYQFLGRQYATDAFHIRVAHRNFSRHLNELIPSLQGEVESAIDDAFGTDTENWTSLNLWEAWLKIVPRTTNHLLVGTEACRDPDFLKSMVDFADVVVINSFILNMVPKTLQPIVGRVIAVRNWWHYRKGFRVLEPVIQRRLDMMARKEGGDPALDQWEPPEDFFTWAIRMARSEGREEELNPVAISKRLIPIEFAAIHTTVITGHFLMLDLLTTDPADGVLDGLRDEAARLLADCGGRWTKDELWRMYRADSAIRESQRVSTFATSLTKRKVMAPEGITNPAEGWHVPQGSYLMLNLDGVQHDGEVYEEPYRYDAFRFSRPREEFDARPADDRDNDEWLQLKKLGMVTTGDNHLAFGHGRHACPGRFFVAHEMKMMLAHMLLKYEIKPLTDRPKPIWIGQTIVPPLDVKIQIRRRKGTV
ncbi:hypothetical protein RB597_003303 [Gaeumannomyces tritici]